MNKMFHTSPTVVLVVLFGVSVVHAVPVYLNDQNMSVSLGGGTNPVSRPTTDPFNNLSTAQSLANVIDASSAGAPEFHNQSTHVWMTGTLELIFDFGQELDLATLHFWNYFGEGFDVDNIELTFFDSTMTNIGGQSVTPALGGPATNDSTPIVAEDIPLTGALNVQFVSALLTGSNQQVDFNNLGFTGEGAGTGPTPVPEPGTLGLVALGLLGLVQKLRPY